MKTKRINGKQKTRDQAVVDNMGFVRQIAHRYKTPAKRAGIEFEDLESIGAIGLMKAFDDFDDSLGYTFTTYATGKLMGVMTRAVHLGLDKEIRYPVHTKVIAGRILKRKLMSEPVEVIAETLNVSNKLVNQALEYLIQAEPVRMEQEQRNDNKTEAITYHELIGTLQDSTALFVTEFLESLTDKERKVVDLVMQGHKVSKIGPMLGYSRNYAPGLVLPSVRRKLLRYQNGEKIPKRVKRVNETKALSNAYDS